MTKHLIPARPALAAIAAVLAFGSTPALAQEAPPQIVAPPVVAPPAPLAEPSAPAPSAATPAMPEAVAPPPAAQAPAATAGQPPVFKPQSPVVQPTPPRPVMATPAPDAEAAPVAAEQETRAAPRERAVERTAAPEATPSAAAPAPAERSAAIAPDATPPLANPLATTAPATAPVVAPLVEAPAEAPVQQADAGMSDEAKFAMGAGAVAILAIGAAFALRRRKDPLEEQVAHDLYVPASAPAPAAPILRDEPVVEVRPAREPVMAAQSHYVPPVYADDTAQPARADAAPASSLEAMIAEPPSQANPFVTRKNRLRRATFLLQNGEASLSPAARVSPEQPAAARQGDTITKEVRTQPVYDFGKASTGWRRLTPATT
jgi:hypothetical protein